MICSWYWISSFRNAETSNPTGKLDPLYICASDLQLCAWLKLTHIEALYDLLLACVRAAFESVCATWVSTYHYGRGRNKPIGETLNTTILTPSGGDGSMQSNSHVRLSGMLHGGVREFILRKTEGGTVTKKVTKSKWMRAASQTMFFVAIHFHAYLHVLLDYQCKISLGQSTAGDLFTNLPTRKWP